MLNDYVGPGISRSMDRHGFTSITSIEDVGSLAAVTAIPVPAHNRHLEATGQRLPTTDLSAAHSRYWQWTGTGASASQMLHDGYPDGLARVQALTAKLADRLPPAQDVKRRPAWTTDGELNVDRWLGGYDECWRGARRRAQPRFLTISLACSWGGNNNLTLEQMTWGGVAACAATLLLEAAGYSVGLSGLCVTVHHGGERELTCLSVKKPGDGLSDSHLAAIFAHSIGYRFHKLRLTETLPYTVHHGHGHSVPLNTDAVEALQAEGVLEPMTLVIPTCRSEADAIAALTTLLEQVQQPTLA